MFYELLNELCWRLYCEKARHRVNLAITNSPKGGLFRGVAVSTDCVIIRRKLATQAQSRQKSSKNPRL